VQRFGEYALLVSGGLCLVSFAAMMSLRTPDDQRGG
jgi:hypothetical protein